MYKKLLVPLDGSPTSRLALAEAAMVARLCGARIELLHVVNELDHVSGRETPAVYIREIRPMFLKAGQELLDAARAELAAEGIEVEVSLQESKGARVSEMIVDRAVQGGADLIVLGTHGRRGVNRVLIGSDAEQVSRTSPVPVMLVRQARKTG